MSISIPFYRHTFPDELLPALTAASEGDGGDAVKALEAKAVASTGMAYALATSTSTAALHLAMCALDLKRGDKVLCPVNSFVDLPEVVRHFDAEPVFVDTLPGSYAIDPEKLAEAAEKIKGKKLRAVLINHPGGKLAPMEAIREVADAYNLKIIEDASEIIGSPEIGRYSDMAVIGFGTKTDNAIDGGLLLSQTPAYYERGKLLRNHGLVYASDETPYLYDVLDIGCQYRMSEYVAIYCQALFDQIPQENARRKTIAEQYHAALSSVNTITLPRKNPTDMHHQFIVQVGTNRDAFARKLRQKGIEVSVRYVPLNFTKYYKEKYGLKVFDFPSALDGYQKMMSLPIYPELSDDEVAYVCEAIRTIAKSHR